MYGCPKSGHVTSKCDTVNQVASLRLTLTIKCWSLYIWYLWRPVLDTGAVRQNSTPHCYLVVVQNQTQSGWVVQLYSSYTDIVECLSHKRIKSSLCSLSACSFTFLAFSVGGWTFCKVSDSTLFCAPNFCCFLSHGYGLKFSHGYTFPMSSSILLSPVRGELPVVPLNGVWMNHCSVFRRRRLEGFGSGSGSHPHPHIHTFRELSEFAFSLQAEISSTGQGCLYQF